MSSATFLLLLPVLRQLACQCDGGRNADVGDMKLRLLLATALVSGACRHREADRSRDSAAFDAGVMAHTVAKKSEKAIEMTGRELGKGAHEVYKGWKQAAREDKEQEKAKRKR
jgi:hypothetical protein